MRFTTVAGGAVGPPTSVAVLRSGREETKDSPRNNAQDALAVRKQEQHLTNFDLILADRYPKWNNPLLLRWTPEPENC